MLETRLALHGEEVSHHRRCDDERAHITVAGYGAEFHVPGPQSDFR